MNSSMPIDAEYMVKLCSDTITLIDRKRTYENELFFENFKEQYFKSWTYKIRLWFGCKQPTKAQLYSKMCETETSWLSTWPSDCYYYERKLAHSILSGANEALLINRTNDAVQLTLAIDEFNSIHRTYKKLTAENIPAYFNYTTQAFA